MTPRKSSLRRFRSNRIRICLKRSCWHTATSGGIVFTAFAPLGHGIRPGPLEDPVIARIAARLERTPAQVLLAWAVQRGTAVLTTPKTAARARENFDISALPSEAFDEINAIETRQRFNEVVKTGSPGFIPPSTA
ncbi:exported hypothetical protein [Paraburkholderia piptadeniae]|uniref:Uncharacterized protein n=1 Tax=Paraburkholderia piptadeniae TaxID=1701573 RepID=A0A1N7RYK1_9BURK|nr:exported hypothetical protein [Paraburkholderia piptadeniae]